MKLDGEELIVVYLTYEESKTFIDLHLTGFAETVFMPQDWIMKSEKFLESVRLAYQLPKHMVVIWDLNKDAVAEHFDEATTELARVMVHSENVPDETKIYLKIKWSL